MNKYCIFILTFIGSLSINSSAQIVAGDTTGPNIYYYNIPDIFFERPFHTSVNYYLDINNDAIDDLRFYMNQQGSPMFSLYEGYVYPLSSIEFVSVPTNSSWVDTVPKGSLISPSSFWANSNLLLYSTWSTTLGVCYGANKYFGFRMISSDTIYGYVYLDHSNGINIKAYANSKKINDFIVYPNPVSSQINIVGPENSNATLFLYDAIGKEVKKQTLNQRETVVDIGGLSNGIYVLKTETNNERFTQKIIIQK